MPAQVPTGTVLLVTTSAVALRRGAIDPTTFQSADRSAEPSGAGGVPTARNTTSALPIAAAASVVKASLPASTLRSTSSSRPGS